MAWAKDEGSTVKNYLKNLWGSKKIAIPSVNDLFVKFFDRWYDDNSRKWKKFPGIRPDIMHADHFVNRAASDLSPLNPETQAKVSNMVTQMYEAAQNDWPRFVALKPPVSIEWVDTYDRICTRKQIAKLLEISSPEDFSNPYLIHCCELGAVMGYVLQQQLPSLQWLYAWPYWESSLFHPPTGNVIWVFHWAIKKMSEYGVDDGFAAKINACVNKLRLDEQGKS
jgi:hypothetical protein